MYLKTSTLFETGKYCRLRRSAPRSAPRLREERAEFLVGLGDGGTAMLLDEGEDAGQGDHEEQRNLDPEEKSVIRCFCEE